MAVRMALRGTTYLCTFKSPYSLGGHKTARTHQPTVCAVPAVHKPAPVPCSVYGCMHSWVGLGVAGLQTPP
jgi:hypothetical protein